VTKKALSAARHRALAGEPHEALALLLEMAATGSVSASASVAELTAFRARWPNVVTHAARLLSDPSAVYAGNVFDDMVRLMALAGVRGAPWADILDASQEALERASLEERRHLRERRIMWLEALVRLARSEGEDADAWPMWTTSPKHERNEEAFERAVAKAPELRPKLLRDEDAMARHVFALAVTFGVPEAMVEKYFEAQDAMDFEAAVNVARHLAASDPVRAWTVLEGKLPTWHPVDQAQVAPVVLLADPALRPLCTPERAALVLHTPRGPRG
jgi:hypothetical protein